MKTSGRSSRPLRLVIAGVAALGLTVVVASPPPAFAGRGDQIVLPDVPFDLQVEEGNELYRAGHAEGTQNYICLPCPNKITSDPSKCPASGFAWAFVGPQATLFDGDDGDDHQIITHFNSPNPVEAGQERPTWQDSRDTSTVWANNTSPPAKSSTDTAFVRLHSIAWLLLPAAGAQEGPTGGDRLTRTTFVQRLNTNGGVAPDASTCAKEEDVGKKALQPYSADYFFYRRAR